MQHKLLFSSFLLLFICASCGKNESSKGEEIIDNRTPVFKIFNVLTGTRPGNFGATASEAITFLDGLCATDFGASFKAFIASSVRNPSIDWVLKPNTEYRRSDSTTIIGTTNSNSVFNFPLDNSITPSWSQYWSGFDANWNLSSNNCSDWTNGTNSTTGSAGNGENNNSGSISYSTPSCNLTSYIICVEQ